MFTKFCRDFFRDRRGNIAILSTIMITSLVGVSGLVAEFGNGLLNRMQDQRIADAAALGGGTVYNSTASTTSMTAAVNNIATLNGIPTSDVSASVVNSPSGDGNQAVEVTVQTSVPLVLSRVLFSKNTLPISVSSYAELESGAPGCVMALNPNGSGVTMSGGTAITADQCSVTSNNTVSVPCGDTITTKQVEYGTTISQPCSGIQAPTGGTLTISKGTTTDPLANNSAIYGSGGLVSRLSTVEALASPSAPTVTTETGGTAVAFGYSASTTQSELTADGCSGTYVQPTWTVTCTGSGPYHFGAITLSGGISVNFNTSGSALTTYDFSGSIYNTGSSLTFGPGTYNITGGICTGGGTTTSFGTSSTTSTYNITGSCSTSNGSCPTNSNICNTGTSLTFLGTSAYTLAGGVYNGGGSTLTMTASSFSAGELTGSCGNNATDYSICQVGSPLTINGPTTFTLEGGIYNGGGETLILGSGSTNSFDIGKASTGDSIYVGGGATTTLGNATGTGDVFELAGNMNSGGGGSCLTVSAASEHDINGSILMAGGVTLGAGIYTVADTFQMGANGGGAVTCNGTTIGVYGDGVTLVIGAAGGVPTSGTCEDVAFCAAAGYSDVTLIAPSSGND
ncbi:MAG TPA: TadE/TadG family type IV pilus assembly protein, partial [Rhizomicrobium sp.]|nr:TadE/TadG family type IV pilus assembly protein [Rhizomicrobium sp.]